MVDETNRLIAYDNRYQGYLAFRDPLANTIGVEIQKANSSSLIFSNRFMGMEPWDVVMRYITPLRWSP
jgi:hypothetical protein